MVDLPVLFFFLFQSGLKAIGTLNNIMTVELITLASPWCSSAFLFIAPYNV